MIPNEQTKKSLIGVRYIGAGARAEDGCIVLDEVPGNALGAYLDGGEIVVRCNAQDATGDTMNDGKITIFGNTGDACGYAMRGGQILVKGSAGYRAGIHMKEYRERKPVICIGGAAGSFLGEYQAGGVIVVLGIGFEDVSPVGSFSGTGMHGGKIYIRTEHLPDDLPMQVTAHKAVDESELAPIVRDYCDAFGGDADAYLADTWYVLAPNSKNPYKQLYVNN